MRWPSRSRPASAICAFWILCASMSSSGIERKENTVQAEIVVIGTELLLGQIIDTNGAYLAQQLSSIGIDLYYKSAVGDNKERIVETLKMASERSDLVLTTGGIGPTLDDMTRESVAEVLGVALELKHHLLEQIKAMMGARYTENNARPAHRKSCGDCPRFYCSHPTWWRHRELTRCAWRVAVSHGAQSDAAPQGAL